MGSDALPPARPGQIAIAVGIVLGLYVGFPLGLLWAADAACLRTSGSEVREKVSTFNERVASRSWRRACRLLTPQARREYASPGGGDCEVGLKAAALRGAGSGGPIASASVGLRRTSAAVETAAERYELAKPLTGGCSDWRIDSVESRLR